VTTVFMFTTSKDLKYQTWCFSSKTRCSLQWKHFLCLMSLRSFFRIICAW